MRSSEGTQTELIAFLCITVHSTFGIEASLEVRETLECHFFAEQIEKFFEVRISMLCASVTSQDYQKIREYYARTVAENLFVRLLTAFRERHTELEVYRSLLLFENQQLLQSIFCLEGILFA